MEHQPAAMHKQYAYQTAASAHLHERHEQLDHLIVLLKMVPVSIQGAVSIKRNQP